MQEFPDEAGEAVGDGPDGAVIAKSRQKATEKSLEATALLFNRRVSGLIEEPPYVAIPLGAAGAMVLFRALVAPRTNADPGSEIPRRRKRAGIGSDFSDDLLR